MRVALAVAIRAGRGAPIGRGAVLRFAEVEDPGVVAFVVALGALGVALQEQVDRRLVGGRGKTGSQPACDNQDCSGAEERLHMFLPQGL